MVQRGRTPEEPPDRDDWRIAFRPDIPSSARIYDYFLGGKDNYPADRDAADQITAYLPNIREAAQINRALASWPTLNCGVWSTLTNRANRVPARPGDCHYHALVSRRP